VIDLSCFDWVQLIKKSDLPANAKYLGLYLGTFMNHDNDVAWPSMKRISYETGLSIPTARKWLDYLDEKGWLIKKRAVRQIFNPIGGTQKQNEYLANIPEDILRRVNDLLPRLQGGKTVDVRGVNESSKGGKQLSPNNNRITINNNLSEKVQKKSAKPKTLPPWSDDQAFVDLGLTLGLRPRAGEGWTPFKNRVKSAVVGE